MRSAFSSRTSFAVLLLALGVAPTAAPAEPEPRPWSQQDATETATKLHQALKALLADPELDASQATAMQQREHRAAIATVRELEPRVAELRKRLAAGYDRDETLPFFERVEALREEIGAYARQSWLPPATDHKADHAAELMEHLAGYYR